MSTQKLFFSYSRFDSSFALKLAKDLREAGADIWIDQLDIPAGNHWDSAVEGALSTAAYVLVILSNSSVASTNVMDEVSFALESGKKIIPVLLEDCLAPFRLRRLQRIDFTNDYAAGFNQLVQTLSLTINNISAKPQDPSHASKPIESSGSGAANTTSGDEWENNLWDEACKLNTIAAYKNYLNQSIRGDNKGEARLLIKQLELQQKEDEVEALLWQKAKSENTKNLYQHYLQDYPKGKFEALALAALADIEKAEKAEQDRIKELEKEKEKQRLLKEKQEREQKIKEENEKALKEKQERERIKQEENEKALKEKQEKDRIKQEEREKERQEKLLKEQEREKERQIEKEKAAKEKQERERLKQIEKEKELQEQKAHPERQVAAAAAGKRNIFIGVGVVVLVLLIWLVMKMSSGDGDGKAWAAALMKNDSTSFAFYQQKYPSGKHAVQAKQKLDSLNQVQLAQATLKATQMPVDTVKKVEEKNDPAKNATPITAKTKTTSTPVKQAQKLALGLAHRGGVVIWLNPDGEHGLVVSIKEEINRNWESANKICDAYVTGNYSDWRLPTKEELNKIFINRKFLGVYTKGNYWSATEENRNNAWVQNFGNGNQSKSNKQSNYTVRAVQAF